MMETLSVENDTKKTELLLQELKQYGVIFEEDEALKAPEHTLERLLQEVKSKQDTSRTQPQDLFIEIYDSMISDYITKLTAATVSFFLWNPWAALFWPPYYYYNNKTHDM